MQAFKLRKDAYMTKDEASGRAKGGIVRAEVLSESKRKEIAEKGALARWGVKVFRKGNFKKEFGIDVDCYVLDDRQKTAVISKRGMAQAIGFSKRGDRLVGFINSQNMAQYIGRELRAKIENPIIVQRVGSAAGSAVGEETHGYNATILIDICTAILDAQKDGKLSSPRYEKMVAQAQIILGASAKSGIQSLVYALSGYNPTAQEVIDAFKSYIQEEAKKYEPEFPSELYMQWHRLYAIEVPQRGKPWQFKHLTVKHIYYPLAQSQGKIYELIKALKSKDGDRQKKLFQFLNEVGARALRMHLGRVLEMCEDSLDKVTYEDKIRRRFGEQQELELSVSTSAPAEP
jgi:hypothetical protein